MLRSLTSVVTSATVAGAFCLVLTSQPAAGQVYHDWIGNKENDANLHPFYIPTPNPDNFEKRLWADGVVRLDVHDINLQPYQSTIRNWSPNPGAASAAVDYPGIVYRDPVTYQAILPDSVDLDNVRFLKANYDAAKTAGATGDLLTIVPRNIHVVAQSTAYEFHIGKMLMDSGFGATQGYNITHGGGWRDALDPDYDNSPSQSKIVLEELEVRSGLLVWANPFESRYRRGTDSAPFVGNITGGILRVTNFNGMTLFTRDQPDPNDPTRKDLRPFNFAPQDEFIISGTGRMEINSVTGSVNPPPPAPIPLPNLAGWANQTYRIQSGGTLSIGGQSEHSFVGELPEAPGVAYHNKIYLEGGTMRFNTHGAKAGGDFFVTSSSNWNTERQGGGSLGMVIRTNNLQIGGASPVALTLNALSTGFENHGIQVDGVTRVIGPSSIVAGTNNTTNGTTSAPMRAYFLGGLQFDAVGGTPHTLNVSLQLPQNGADMVRIAGPLSVDFGSLTADSNGIASVDLINVSNQSVQEYFLSTGDPPVPVYSGVTSVTSDHNSFANPITGGTRFTSYDDLNATGAVGDYYLRFFNDSGTNTHVMSLMVRIQALIAAIAGDFNNDGVVDADDLDLVLGYWGQSSVPANWVNWIPEGIVAADELDAVLGNWGNTAAALAEVDRIVAYTALSHSDVVSMIPEPTSIALLAVGGLLAIRRRRNLPRAAA